MSAPDDTTVATSSRGAFPATRLVRRPVVEVGALGVLLGRMLSSAIQRPTGYWSDTFEDFAYLVRRVFWPATITIAGYSAYIITFALGILDVVGTPHRVGTVYLSFALREFAPYITGIVVAGVVGTATTAELGARKVRDELDALTALGEDVVRLLVLPRVLAIAVLCVAMSTYAIFMGVGVSAVGANILSDASYGAFLGVFTANITALSVNAAVVKMLLIGICIGVVSCSKGLRAAPGAEGVGRAVNQSVVISLVASFVISILFNMLLLGLNPSINVIR